MTNLPKIFMKAKRGPCDKLSF